MSGEQSDRGVRKEQPPKKKQDPLQEQDALYEGRDEYFMDIDRMVGEGLGGGRVTRDNGLIEDTTTDTMDGPEQTAVEPENGTDE